ncbi:MAG: hypothetical protein PHP54_05080 [Clostridia bacterium]|nr:hypothetical protein [Clostridia bacterium]
MELQILKDGKITRSELIRSLITLILIDNALICKSCKNSFSESRLIGDFLGCRLNLLSPYSYNKYSSKLSTYITSNYPKDHLISLNLEGLNILSEMINIGYIPHENEETILSEIAEFIKNTPFTYINVSDNFDFFHITTTD